MAILKRTITKNEMHADKVSTQVVTTIETNNAEDLLKQEQALKTGLPSSQPQGYVNEVTKEMTPADLADAVRLMRRFSAATHMLDEGLLGDDGDHQMKVSTLLRIVRALLAAHPEIKERLSR